MSTRTIEGTDFTFTVNDGAPSAETAKALQLAVAFANLGFALLGTTTTPQEMKRLLSYVPDSVRMGMTLTINLVASDGPERAKSVQRRMHDMLLELGTGASALQYPGDFDDDMVDARKRVAAARAERGGV